MARLPRLAQLGRTGTWLVLLAAAIWLLTAAGSGALAPPPGLDVAAWRSWAAPRAALTLVFAVLRVATLAAAWYLAGVTIVGLLARFAGQTRLVRAVDIVTVPAARRVLQAALGTGLAVAALSAPEPAGHPEPRHVVAQPVGHPDGAAMLPLTDDARPAAGPVVARPLPVPEPPAAPTAAAPAAETWTVRAGDHLWSIAEATLRARRRRVPSDSETAAYWERLIATNRERLPDPANPDLIRPGDVLELPRIPGRAS